MVLKWVAIAVLALSAARCGGNTSPPTITMPTPAPAPGAPQPTSVSIPSGASVLTVTAYVPNPITVSVGTVITWTNNDTVPHTVSSQNNLWDSGSINPGATYSRTFDTAGSFPYYCAYHPRMVGTIIVQ
jgi:plastocyanin